MSCFRFVAKLSLCLYLALMLTIVSSGQSTTGSISGSVTDSNGGAIPSASVTLINEQNGAKRNVVTNEEGQFNFPAVQPGIYTIRVEQEGFQTFERTNNALTASDKLSLGELALTAGR